MKILKNRGPKIDCMSTPLSTLFQLVVTEPKFTLYFEHLSSLLKTPCLICHNVVPLIWQLQDQKVCNCKS